MKKIPLVTEAYPCINGEDCVAEVEFTFFDHSGKVPSIPEEADFQITNIKICKDDYGELQKKRTLVDEEFYNAIENEDIISSVEETIYEYLDEMYSRYEDAVESAYSE